MVTSGKNLKKGFTLIELLVVIAIIAILVGVAAFGSQGAFENSRDAQRRSDIKQYQTALGNFAAGNEGYFPSHTDIVDTETSGTLCTNLGLTNCSEDPRHVQDSTYDPYYYQSNGTNSGISPASAKRYVLWAKLENVSSTTYWVVCSNGKSGEVTSGIPPSTGTCPFGN